MNSSSTPPDDAALLKQARQWAFRLKNEAVDSQQLTQFRHWQQSSPAHRQAWEQAVSEWHIIQQAAELKAADRPNTLLSSQIALNQGRRRLLWGAAATGSAALASVLVLSPWFEWLPGLEDRQADFRTDTGEQKQIQLAPQLSVLLNTQSSLAVLASGEHTQLQLLKGEAAFTSQGQACSILASGATLSMQHADLDIRHYPDGQSRVRCFNGRVLVSHSRGDRHLQADQQLLFSARHIPDAPQQAAHPDGWRHGRLSFSEQALKDVLDEINRYRPGKIVLLNNDLNQRRFSGEFQIDALDDALQLLQTSYQLTARQLGGITILS